MRAPLPLLTVLAGALLLVACGGGGTTPLGDGLTTAKSTGFLTGEVISVDSRTTALDGVLLSVRETGAVVLTELDGSFSFGEVPTGTLTIDVLDVPAVAAKSGENSGGENSNGHGDDDPPHGDQNGDGLCDEAGHQHQHGECFDDEEVEDGEDADETDLSLHRLREQERIHVRIRLEDGVIGTMECVRDQNRERETETVMTCSEGCSDPEMKGKLELESREDRERVKARVERCDEGRQLELWAVAPNGEQEGLGTRTCDADGQARWTLNTAEGARLPFGHAGVEDLEGYRFEIRNAGDGAVQLRANAPEMPQARVRGHDE